MQAGLFLGMNFLIVLGLFDEAGDQVKFLTVVLLYVGLPEDGRDLEQL